MSDQWIRAKACSTSACVEVQAHGDRVVVRSSEEPDWYVAFTHEEWGVFIDGVKAGDFAGTTR